MNREFELYPNVTTFNFNPDHTDNDASLGSTVFKVEDQFCSANVSLQDPVSHGSNYDSSRISSGEHFYSVENRFETKLFTDQNIPNKSTIRLIDCPEVEDSMTQPLKNTACSGENGRVFSRNEVGPADCEQVTLVVKQEDPLNCVVSANAHCSSIKCEPVWDIPKVEEFQNVDNTYPQSASAENFSDSVSGKESVIVSEVCSVGNALAETSESKSFMQELKQNAPTLSVNKFFECQYCGARFPRAGLLTRHERTHTGEKPFKCQHCDAKFSLASSRQNHERIHTGEKPFKCQHCDAKFFSTKSRNRHERIHTREMPYQCQYCDAKFARASDMKRHKKLHIVEKPFTCQYCDAKFARSYNMKVHERIHTREQSFDCKQGDLKPGLSLGKIDGQSLVCQYCGAKFVSSNCLEGHVRKHTGEKPYECQLCGAKFTNRSHLKYHETKHSGETFKCQLCPATLSSSVGMKYHERVHTGEKPFKCQFCDATFIQSSGLKLHLRVHTGKTDLKKKCQNCRATFPDRIQFHRHIAYCSAKHACQYCYVKCRSLCSLKRHELIHTGEKPFQCNFCSARFRVKVALQKHTLTHTGEKPFACQYCDAKLASAHVLQSHEKIHTGERPFQCNICDAGFIRITDLKYHMRSHTGETVFKKCEHCDAICTNRSQYYRHRKTHRREGPL